MKESASGGESHGQSRQARTREEKAKEKGNQASEHAGETSGGIQTASGAVTAATNWREDIVAERANYL
jgi:hypothetical protein